MLFLEKIIKTVKKDVDNSLVKGYIDSVKKKVTLKEEFR